AAQVVDGLDCRTEFPERRLGQAEARLVERPGDALDADTDVVCCQYTLQEVVLLEELDKGLRLQFRRRAESMNRNVRLGAQHLSQQVDPDKGLSSGDKHAVQIIAVDAGSAKPRDVLARVGQVGLDVPADDVLEA